METLLDGVVRGAREAASRYVPGEQLNKLQSAFREETRILLRLESHVSLIESPTLAGTRERVCFALADHRRGRRVAIDLIPERMDQRLASRERVHGVLAGGDVDAMVIFRGKDIIRNPDDCICLLARFEPELFSEVGFEHVRVNANPTARAYELNRNGTTFVPVPWTTDEGEDAIRFVRVTRRARKYPRRLAA